MDAHRKRVLLLNLFYRRLKRKRPKRFWIHPIIPTKDRYVYFSTRFHILKSDELKFFNYYRMSIASYTELEQKIMPTLQKQYTNMREPISPQEMLSVTLRYLITGTQIKDLHYTFGLGCTTIATILRQVCKSLWDNLLKECIPEINTELLEKNAEKFAKYANFPHCIGAVDGKHIEIQKPPNTASLYFNYKDFYSFVLMAVVDADYCFVFVDIGAYGGSADSTIFNKSGLWQAINAGTIELPIPKPLPHSNTFLVPYVFVADEAFGLHESVMRPYSGKFLSTEKKIFNYRLSRARRFVECAFGIMASKWRIFHRPLDVSIDFAIDIVKACCILHNYVKKRDGLNSRTEAESAVHEFENIEASERVRSGQRANKIRNEFKEYFMSRKGALSWQMSKIS